jgi:Ca2+-binding EF-hand superfamily protein
MNNSQGEVSVKELASALRRLGIRLTDDQIAAFVGELDVDKSGEVSLQEFKEAVEVRKPKSQTDHGLSSLDLAWQAVLKLIEANPRIWERSITRLFHSFDKDASGEIDISELEAGLVAMQVHMAADQVMALRDDLDANRDGHISLHEFTTAVLKRRKKMAAMPAIADDDEEDNLSVEQPKAVVPTTAEPTVKPTKTTPTDKPVEPKVEPMVEPVEPVSPSVQATLEAPVEPVEPLEELLAVEPPPELGDSPTLESARLELATAEATVGALKEAMAVQAVKMAADAKRAAELDATNAAQAAIIDALQAELQLLKRERK